jgi:hypothetical protein
MDKISKPKIEKPIHAIYVLSDSENPNRYKVGHHKGTLDKLRKRYITAIPTLIVHYFIEISNPGIIETQFKEKHIDKRIGNSNQRLSEWVNMQLGEIMNSLIEIMDSLIKINSELRIIKEQMENINKNHLTKSTEPKNDDVVKSSCATSEQSIIDKAEFRKSKNSIDIFLNEQTETTSSTKFTSAKDLYTAYVKFCGNNFDPENKKNFGSYLTKKYKKGKSGYGGNIIYSGIKLIDYTIPVMTS